MRRLLLCLTLALLAAPLAAAQEDTTDPARPDDAAWVEDCPPDHMCAANDGDSDTKRPDDGGCEAEGCVYKGDSDEPIPFGPEGCIECSGPAPSGGSGTCMDGADAGEECQPDVQYLGGPTRGPSDGSCENCRGPTASDDGGEVTIASAGAANAPAPAIAAGIVFLAAVAMLALPGKRS